MLLFVSPHVCFILVLILISMFLRYSGVAYVTKICSRGHFLLIRVCIHQNVCLYK